MAANPTKFSAGTPKSSVLGFSPTRTLAQHSQQEWQVGKDEFLLKMIGGHPSDSFSANMTGVKAPGCPTIADVISFILYGILFPCNLAVVIAAFFVLSVPIGLVQVYTCAYMQRPQRVVVRDAHFRLFSVMFFLVSLPAMCFAVMWAVVSSLAILLPTLPIGILRAPYTLQSLQILWAFGGGPGGSCDKGWSRASPAGLARGYGILWTIQDLACALIGVVDRHGVAQVTLSMAVMVGMCPCAKLLLANPFLFNLEEVYINQWSAAIDANGDGVCTSEDQPLIRSEIQDTVCSVLLEEDKRKEVEHWPFSGFHPFPPLGRPSGTVLGVQMVSIAWLRGRSLINLISHTTHPYLIPDHVPRSQYAAWGLLIVWLQSWNPWYLLTGYVEVNVRKDGGVEHPMWLILDPRSQLSISMMRYLNVLFADLGQVFAGYMKKQPAFKDHIDTVKRNSVEGGTPQAESELDACVLGQTSI